MKELKVNPPLEKKFNCIQCPSIYHPERYAYACILGFKDRIPEGYLTYLQGINNEEERERKINEFKSVFILQKLEE